MNKKLLFKIYDYTCAKESRKKFGIAIAKYSEPMYYGIYFLGAVIIAVGNLYLLPKYISIPFIVLAYNTFVRKILNRPRPFVKENIKELLTHKANGSCPSNHAASSMIISFAWWCICPYFTALFGIMALFTGISRVMVGVHYPFDVVLGWLVGIFFGILGFIIL